MRTPALLVVLALLVGGCTGAIDPNGASSPGQTLKLAAWNMEHLAERDGTGCRPWTEADYAAMRGYVAELDADVIAFQEVESKAAAE